MVAKEYFQSIMQIMEQVLETQEEAMVQAADLLADAAAGDSRIYAFGCGHAGLLAQELFYRTGGLAVINPLLPPGLCLDTVPVTLTSGIERLTDYGRMIVDAAGLRPGDVLLIHSVSGRNTVPVDVAVRARELGVTVIALTNLRYSQAVESRHPSGQRLYEVSDLVLDNCGPHGDAVLEIPGLPEKVSPSSTVVGAAILNALVGEVVARLVDRGMTPPVFISANLDGGDEHNAQVLQQYREKIDYLGG